MPEERSVDLPADTSPGFPFSVIRRGLPSGKFQERVFVPRYSTPACVGITGVLPWIHFFVHDPNPECLVPRLLVGISCNETIYVRHGMPVFVGAYEQAGNVFHIFDLGEVRDGQHG